MSKPGILCLLASLFTYGLAANHFAGITASNSIGGTSSYTCRTQVQWNDLANNARNNGFRSLRISGFDCDALDRASSAASAAGITLLVGIYIPGTIASSTSAINEDVQAFIKAYKKYGAGLYIGLTIGNEVNDSPNSIMNKVLEIRNYLRSASVRVTTLVSTVHTWVDIRNNPVLCGGDFIAANAHAFFDGKVSSGQAGDFIMKSVIPSLKSACPGKRVILAESGWPSRGSSNGAASPSLESERLALLNLNCAARGDASVFVYAFEYDDQSWKGSDVERSFGMYGKLALNGDVLAAC